MRRLRGAWRLLCALLHALQGLLVVLLLFPHLGRDERRERVREWSRRMLRRLGLRLVVHGALRPGAKMLVANHISWLDVMVVHALCPEARFVAKAEVRRWPLVHRLADAADTLYIERAHKRDALRVVHQCADALRAGDTVAAFPEGTTGPGHELLPFHANLLQAAIAVGAPLQPLALRYADRHQAVSASAPWIGATTLAQSLWRLALAEDLTVHLCVLAPRATLHAERRHLSAKLRQDIEAAQAALDRRHPAA
jgi:1-acyl-sn-glycerol-3-phosphate acyltransferase